MPVIDLDAARAAREEARGTAETPTAVFRGKSFDLPTELPFGVFLVLGDARQSEDSMATLMALRDLMHSIFGDQAQDFLALNPSLEDMTGLVGGLVEGYEVGEPGESQASPKPS